MEDQALKNIWKNSSTAEKIKLNMPQLLKDFKNGMEYRERIVRRRDRREIIGALAGAFTFGYSFFAWPNPISRAGAILGLVGLAYMIFKLRNNRKSKFVRNLFLPIQEELINQKRFMLSQHRLLDTVMYWLSIPVFLANALIVWGISKSDHSLTLFEQLTTKWGFKVAMTIGLALLFGYIGWMNKRAAKVNWEPLIKQVNGLLESGREE